MARSNSVDDHLPAPSAPEHPDGGGWRRRLVEVGRSLGSTLLMTAAMVGVVLLLSGGPLKQGEAVSFALKDVSGERVSSAELHGKPAVLYFWATWCTACKLTTGTVESYAARNSEVPVIAVSPEAPDVVASYLAGRDRPLRTVAEGGRLMQQLGVRAFPTTVVLDAEGRVVWNRSGILAPGELDLRAP